MPTIKFTENTRNQISERCKMLFGHAVKIGNDYDGVCVIHGNRHQINKKLQALLYENGRLLLSSANRKYFVIVGGDIAAHGKIIYAEYIVTSINFNVPVTVHTDVVMLKDKYHFVPPKLIDAIINAVSLLP